MKNVKSINITAKIEGDFWDNEKVLNAAIQACHDAKFSIIKTSFHKFYNFEENKEQGITVSCILGESHFYIHTFPEYNYALVSCLTCSEKVHPKDAINGLNKLLNSKVIEIFENKLS